MPQEEWEFLRQTYCNQFYIPVLVTKIKNFATNKRSNAELKIQEKVASKTESTKRTKLACHSGNSIFLRETRHYLKIKQLFDSKIKELKEIEIAKVERTRKIPFNKVDAELLNLIDYVINGYVRYTLLRIAKVSPN
ncbi:hypothetical protein NUSPORA_00794 [Nucleospora cyclopteri]